MRRLVVAPLLVTVLAACVSDGRPAEEVCNAPTIELEVTLTATDLGGDALNVCQDQEVAIVVTPEVDGVIHIHGYDDYVPATEVVAGEPTTLEFVAEKTGQFHVEFHAADDPQGVEVGIFAVYDR